MTPPTHTALLQVNNAALFSPFSCSSNSWSNTALPCWSTWHIAIVATSTVLIVAQVPLAVYLSLILVNRVGSAKNLLCQVSSPAAGRGTGARDASVPRILGSLAPFLAAPQSHGRVSAALVTLRVFLAAYDQLHVGAVSPVLTDIIYLLAGLAWFGLVLVYLPYFHQWLNRLQCGLAAVFTTAAVCSLLAQATSGDPSSPPSSPAGWVFFFLLPSSFWSGWSLASARFQRIGSSKKEPSSPFFVDLRIRYILSSPYNAGDSEAQYLSGGDGGGGPEPNAVVIGDADQALQHEKRIANRLETEVDAALAAGLAAFPTSAMMELFAALYSGGMASVHLERIHLRAASLKADPTALDINFFCYHRSQQLDEANQRAAGGCGGVTAVAAGGGKGWVGGWVNIPPSAIHRATASISTAQAGQ